MREMLRKEELLSPRKRRIALVVLLLVQTAMFLAFLPMPVRVLSDNTRYEQAGWYLETGHGLSLTDATAADPEVRRWVCERHPDACADGISPTTMYPPGYQVFIAGVYSVTGRSAAALAVANWLLLLGLFVLLESLAARLLPALGYAFVMGVALAYPFFAAQAVVIMSDQLHATLLLGALSALLLMKPGVTRGAVFGLLLAAATLTRPYCMFVVPALFLWRPLHRAIGMGRREWVISALVCAVPFIGWTLRNAYWFGRFIPFSTTGVGVTLFTTAFEMNGGDVYTPAGHAQFYDALGMFGADAMAYLPDQKFVALAKQAFLEHPGRFVLEMLKHVPKLWISLGHDGVGISRAWPVLVLYLGTLLVLGCIGMWLTRRDARWHALSISVLVNWAVPLAGEARRTLPLRLPMLLLGAVTVVELARWYRRRRLDTSTTAG